MFEVAYDKRTLKFDLPPQMEGLEVRSKPAPALPSPGETLASALEDPLGSPPLQELLTPRKKICIVVPDATRPFPVRELLPVVLNYLTQYGLPDDRVEVAIAYGLHRKLSEDEKVGFLGKEVVSRYGIIDHDATDSENLVRLGETASGVPIDLNRAVVDADLVLGLGVVEPHQYAGYSGGAKTVAIGMAGAKTIVATHSIGFIDHPGTGLDRVEGNIFSDALWEIVSPIKFGFAVNIMTNDEGDVTAISAGDPKAVYKSLVDQAREIMRVAIEEPVDMVIAGVGYPKDVNLYQASRAVTYLVMVGTPILKPGGVIIITAKAGEGVGYGLGERNFRRYFKEYPQIEAMMDKLREEDFAPGAQRAYMLGKALMKHKVFVVGADCPDGVRDLGMTPVADIPQALYLAMKLIQSKPAKVLVVPHALQTLPTLAAT